MQWGVANTFEFALILYKALPSLKLRTNKSDYSKGTYHSMADGNSTVMAICMAIMKNVDHAAKLSTVLD